MKTYPIGHHACRPVVERVADSFRDAATLLFFHMVFLSGRRYEVSNAMNVDVDHGGAFGIVVKGIEDEEDEKKKAVLVCC
ncbi:hypothetical protein Hanom_Chr05g00436941 [Helianthus anomalus]